MMLDKDIIRTLYGYYMDMVEKDTLLHLVGRASHLPFGGRVPYWHRLEGHPIAIWWASSHWHMVLLEYYKDGIRIIMRVS